MRLSHACEWKTNRELHAECQDVSTRTVRATTAKFVHLGILDQFEVFNGYRYRLLATSGGYMDRLRQVAGVFGVALAT